ncbi:MAG: thiamine pyrophosphate-binding protein [Candidatus Lokiarchaeota archaeon]|nr:thiamine pyrophosphate-binding protein [Candidatus Lokiarchaeota archaeon]
MTKKKKKEIFRGGDIVVKGLIEENVRYIFGIVGGQLLPIYDAVYRWGREHGIDTIAVRHEQAAAHMADAYARLTGNIGVCMGTVGPGATDMVPGVGAAFSDNIPVLVITPQLTKKEEGLGSLQGGIDHVSMYEPITKYQKHIHNPDKLEHFLHRALSEAMAGRPKPVHLDIVVNVLTTSFDKKELLKPNHYRPISKPEANTKDIQEAIKLLEKAEKPLLISGGGVSMSGAWNEVQELAEYLATPVIVTRMGIGTFNNKHPTFLGGPGLVGGGGTQAASQTDLIIAFGTRFSLILLFGNSPPWNADAKLIHIDIDPVMIGKNRPVDVGIVSDAKIAAQKMLKMIKEKGIKKRDVSEWTKSLLDLKKNSINKIIKRCEPNTVPIHPSRLVKDVLEFIPDDAILAIDGGNILGFIQEQICSMINRPPRSVLQSVGMGHLGCGLPYAISAKLVHPDRAVYHFTGDGSFGFNIQELETAVRYNLPIINVIANDSAWGMIKAGQKNKFKKRYIDCDLPNINYAEIGKGFGCYGERITEPEQITEALKRATESKKPAVVDVVIDPKKIPMSTILYQNLI